MSEDKLNRIIKRLEKDKEEVLAQEEFFKGKPFPEIIVARRNHRAYIESLLADILKEEKVK